MIVTALFENTGSEMMLFFARLKFARSIIKYAEYIIVMCCAICYNFLMELIIII